MKTTLKPTEKKYLKHLAKNYILLPTKFKRPLVKNWNSFGKQYYLERRSIEKLLETNQEYSLRTGKKVSQHYYFIALDLDDIWASERIQVSRYVKTARGIHRYLWIKELPKSCWLVNKEGDKKIGELHSLGRFVVGIGSIHKTGIRYSLKGKNSLKWSLKFETLRELQEFLTHRNIFTTPWGKTGKENIRNLEPYQTKTKPLISPNKIRSYVRKTTKINLWTKPILN